MRVQIPQLRQMGYSIYFCCVCNLQHATACVTPLIWHCHITEYENPTNPNSTKTTVQGPEPTIHTASWRCLKQSYSPAFTHPRTFTSPPLHLTPPQARNAGGTHHKRITMCVVKSRAKTCPFGQCHYLHDEQNNIFLKVYQSQDKRALHTPTWSPTTDNRKKNKLDGSPDHLASFATSAWLCSTPAKSGTHPVVVSVSK